MLVMLQGEHKGRELAPPQGDSVLGRSGKADIFIGGSNVSGRHALPHVTEHGAVVVKDLQSTNGTWVNGDRLQAPTQLSDGDVVGLGDVNLRFQNTSTSTSTSENLEPLPGRTSVQSGRRAPTGEDHPRQRRRAVAIAGACEIVLAVIGASSNTMGPLFGPLATAAVGVLCALAVMFFEYVKAKPSEASGNAAAPDKSREVVYWMGGPRWLAVHQRPGVTGILAVVLVLGTAGILLASVANYAVFPNKEAISGDGGGRSAVERLSREQTAAESGLSLTVTSVKESGGVTRVGIRVSNALSTAVSLPVFGNCQLSSADGQALEADPFHSNWGTSVPANQERQGVVAFKDQLPSAGVTATFSFIHVFGGPSVPNSLTVSDLILVPKQRDSSITATVTDPT